MISKSKILKAIFQLQVDFNKEDKQQIERIIFNSPSEEEWDQFIEIQQNIQSLYLNNLEYKKQINISNFSSLKQLFWNSAQSGEEEEIPMWLQLELKSLKNLCELNLRLNSMTDVCEDFFKVLFEENLQYLENFNKFSIFLNQCSLSEGGINGLTNYLTVLKNLKHLLIFYHPSLSYGNQGDSFLQKIWVSISQLDILESFHLDLNGINQLLSEEFDFQQVLQGKPICSSLKHLRLLILQTIYGLNQIKLLNSLKEFNKLETFIFQQETHTLLKEVDEQLVGILNNNRNTLKKIDLWLFQIMQKEESAENLDVQYEFPFKCLDQIKNLQKLERFKMFTNMFNGLQEIKNLTENVKECKLLMQFYLQFSLSPFDDFDQSEFKQIYNDLITLPYLTHCFADIRANNYLADSFKKTQIDVFDVQNQITNYFDPFTVSKGYKKYEKELEENKISIEKLLSIFKQNLQNNTISEKEFIIPNIPPKDKKKRFVKIVAGSTEEMDEERYYVDNTSSSYDSESEDNFSFSSEENLELFIQNKFLLDFLNQKNSEICKIHIFKDKICIPIKEILGDLSLIKYLYWDLYI